MLAQKSTLNTIPAIAADRGVVSPEALLTNLISPWSAPPRTRWQSSPSDGSSLVGPPQTVVLDARAIWTPGRMSPGQATPEPDGKSANLASPQSVAT